MSPVDLGPDGCGASRQGFHCHKLSGHGSDPHHDVVMDVGWRDSDPPTQCVRCGGTERIPRPPEGDPPFQREYLQEIPCPSAMHRCVVCDGTGKIRVKLDRGFLGVMIVEEPCKACTAGREIERREEYARRRGGTWGGAEGHEQG